MFIFEVSRVVLHRGGEANAGENAMRHIFLIAITIFGVTAAQAQTASTGGIGVGSDPLSVPTSSLPTGSSSSSGSASGGPITTGSAGGNSSTAGVSASPSSNPQAPLLLPGEMSSPSPQAPITMAPSPSHSSTICPPPIPTTDGGSANLTDMVGGSLNGC